MIGLESIVGDLASMIQSYILWHCILSNIVERMIDTPGEDTGRPSWAYRMSISSKKDRNRRESVDAS